MNFIRLIIILLIFYLAYRIVKTIFRMALGWGKGRGQISGEGELVKDPVCGTYIPRKEALSLKVEKDLVYFCSLRCLNRFKEGGYG